MSFALVTPTADAKSACRDLAYEHMVEVADLAASYSRSLAEAAWRRDRLTCEVHLRQLRLCAVDLIGTFKMLDGEGSVDG